MVNDPFSKTLNPVIHRTLLVVCTKWVIIFLFHVLIMRDWNDLHTNRSSQTGDDITEIHKKLRSEAMTSIFFSLVNQLKREWLEDRISYRYAIGYGFYLVRLNRNSINCYKNRSPFHAIETVYPINNVCCCRLAITDNNDERIQRIRTNWRIHIQFYQLMYVCSSKIQINSNQTQRIVH